MSPALRRGCSAPGIALLVAAAVVTTGAPAGASLPRDKVLHLQVSAGLAAGGYLGAALITEDRPLRAGLGFGAAVLVGGAKELADAAGLGHPSAGDMLWNIVGAALGAGLAWWLDRPPRAPRPLLAGASGDRWEAGRGPPRLAVPGRPDSPRTPGIIHWRPEPALTGLARAASESPGPADLGGSEAAGISDVASRR